MKVALLDFSMCVCPRALADHKGAHQRIGEEYLDLATAIAKCEP